MIKSVANARSIDDSMRDNSYVHLPGLHGDFTSVLRFIRREYEFMNGVLEPDDKMGPLHSLWGKDSEKIKEATTECQNNTQFMALMSLILRQRG